ncbi:MAG: LLM class flavin-dependent oxidoreductase, partial [Dehalococcoidia bacterium]
TSIALYTPAIRVAEEVAMLDVISGGRIISGFPIGTSQDTNWCYGRPPATLRERYYEAEELIIKAWTSRKPFSFHGKYNQLRYVNIWPRPVQQPHPPIWVPGGGSVETWDWTIEKDYVYAALSFAGHRRAQVTMDGYWERSRELGAEDNPYRVAFIQLVCVSDSMEQAKKDYGDGVLFFYHRLLGSTGSLFPEAPGYRTERSIRAGFVRSAAVPQTAATAGGQRKVKGEGPTWEQLVEEGNIIAGNPDEVAAQLREAMTRLRVGQLLPLLQIGGMRRDATMKNIKMFGNEVLPQIRDMWDDEYEDRWSPKPLQQRAAVAPAPH